MARPKLGSLLSDVTGGMTAEETPAQPTPQQTKTRESAAPAPVKQPQAAPATQAARRGEAEAQAKTPAGRAAKLPESAKAPKQVTVDAEPLFSDLVRKEARFTDDQIRRLTELTHDINSRRRARQRNGIKADGPRITENTLLRIALDLLLDRGQDLDGATDAELRASVGL